MTSRSLRIRRSRVQRFFLIFLRDPTIHYPLSFHAFPRISTAVADPSLVTQLLDFSDSPAIPPDASDKLSVFMLLRTPYENSANYFPGKYFRTFRKQRLSPPPLGTP